MKKIKIILTGILFVLLANTAMAKINTKDKAIEIVVPYAPGGAATNAAHFVAAAFKEQGLETTVVNKPGNATIIAANYVAKSQSTGHTLLVTGGATMATNVVFKAEGMEYNENNFTPIVTLNTASLGLYVKEDGPIKTYEDLKSYIRKNPKEFNVGFYSNNLVVIKEWARRENLPEPNIVMYKGGAPALVDVAGGTILLAFDNFGWGAPSLPLIEAGKLRLIATLDNSATKQISKMKNPVTDIAKIYPDLRFSVWLGVFAPAGTPKGIIDEMNQIINKAVANTNNKVQVELMDGVGGTTSQLDELVKRDIRTLKKFADVK